MTYQENQDRQAEIQLRVQALHKLYFGTDPSKMCYQWYMNEVAGLRQELQQLQESAEILQEIGIVKMRESI